MTGRRPARRLRLAEFPFCRACWYPLDPAAMVGPRGRAYDTHPACEPAYAELAAAFDAAWAAHAEKSARRAA
jgi:hypothetical protein